MTRYDAVGIDGVQSVDISTVKEKAEELAKILDYMPMDERSRSIAKTNLETTVLYATKGIAVR